MECKLESFTPSSIKASISAWDNISKRTEEVCESFSCKIKMKSYFAQGLLAVDKIRKM